MTPKNRSTVSVVTLGCPKNRVDSEVMLGHLVRRGYRPVEDPRKADVIVVNTCAFIEDAKKESIDAILQASRWKGKGGRRTLVVSGCLAQRYGAALKEEMPEIDVLVGIDGLQDVADRVEKRKDPVPAGAFPPSRGLAGSEAPRILSGPVHSAYLKISEGCDLRCSFCAIPSIRGSHRSRSVRDVLREAGNLVRLGVREINLVAQDSSRYGHDRVGRSRTAELLRALSKVEGLEWVRLHYLYPARLDEELIRTIAGTPKVCPYFDVPLQHASDRVLKAMKRVGNRAFLERMIRKIRRLAPQAALRTTFLVGFPGETDRDLEELLAFLGESRFDHAGFFAYSREEGTPAADLPGQVPDPVKIERLNRAVRVQEETAPQAHERWVGTRWTAVVEGRSDGRSWGRTPLQAPEVDGVTWIEGPMKARPGDRREVVVTGVLEQDLLAREVKA